MKFTGLLSAILIGWFCVQAVAQDSFRTADGILIERGMTKAEVLDVLGPPESEQLVSDDLDIDLGTGSVDSWNYIRPGSIGGPYLLRIEFKGGEVREVRAEPLE